MPIIRTYLCGECNARFDHFHLDRAEAPPECPGCLALAARSIPAGFSIPGNASKAGDIAQGILETDYGMTNFRDRSREGDISVITPPHLQKAVDGMWSPPGAVIAAAKAGAAASRAEGSNPLTLVQKVAKVRGTAKPPVSVVARG